MVRILLDCVRLDGSTAKPRTMRSIRLPGRSSGAAAREIAVTARNRLQDLQQSPLPYRDVGRLAAFFRTALIVAFLAECAIRLRSLASLDKHHFTKPQPTVFSSAGTPTLHYEVNIPGVLMKSGDPCNHPMTKGLSELFDVWFDEVRPLLLADHADVSLPSSFGQGPAPVAICLSKEPSTLYRRLLQLPHPPPPFSEIGWHGTGRQSQSGAASSPTQRSQFAISLSGCGSRRDRDRSTSLRHQTCGFFDFVE